MIKFFRNIRRTLLNEGKTNKYIKYAIGEIVLVVIGILIALQINNWNENRKTTNKTQKYYHGILSELKVTANAIEDFQIYLDSTIQKNKKILQIINSKNQDSLLLLEHLLGEIALANGLPVNLSLPITDEFINQDLQSQIKNDSLRRSFWRFIYARKFINSVGKYSENQYATSIEPYYIKHINYSQIAITKYKKGLVKGGPNTDYKALGASLEFWNIASLKLESYTAEKEVLDNFISRINTLIKIIESELKQDSHD
ncbi:DUF6090 family protein [Aestuariibaculum sediminum]|uniref:Uncharacterized protein n=1 Tax=Aestuariibaculum sediminum TaxID=2770637 RepID=A0A8J6Q878_9FLAO|nr:DUF6090 family protein [Aestuariibaculum sediminum]MBD0832415.1 hypothetical protein [Aestuariibaculum sediminum]